MPQPLMPKKLKFYDDLQDLLERTHTHTHTKDVLFILGTGMKSRKPEVPEITGKFDLGVQNEAGKG